MALQRGRRGRVSPSRHRQVDISSALVLVTGAGSGIGRATALAFASRGARVLATDINEETAAKTAADCGGQAYRLDVSDRGDVSRIAEAVLSHVGVPDVLVNNAGVGMTGSFLDTDNDDWDWILGINVMGAVHMCQAFGPAMVACGHGHVVNVSSGLAYTPRATESAYVTTKAAILAFSQCLRADWHGHDVGVSAICPGIIDTNIVKGNTRFRGHRLEAESRQRVETLFGRGHKPEKVAAAIIDAVEHNRSVVSVGAEAWFGWLSRGIVPQRSSDLFARLDIDKYTPRSSRR